VSSLLFDEGPVDELKCLDFGVTRIHCVAALIKQRRHLKRVIGDLL
jgi:hypothetical protein